MKLNNYSFYRNDSSEIHSNLQKNKQYLVLPKIDSLIEKSISVELSQNQTYLLAQIRTQQLI